MNDRDFFPRFYDPEDKVMLYWQCYMQSAFNRLTNTQHFGLLYNLLRNPNIIVMRCTGLRDKNGKLIYEGDIVKEWFGETGTYQVIYENSTASFIFSNLNDEDYDYDLRQNPDLFPDQDLKIIGNIHENPELLEAS